MNIVLIIITVLLAIITVSLILLLVEVQLTFRMLRKIIEAKIDPILEEARPAVKDIQRIVDKLSEATVNVTEFTKSVGDVGRTISVVNQFIGSASSSTAVKIVSMRAGIRAALGYLFANLTNKGGDK